MSLEPKKHGTARSIGKKLSAAAGHHQNSVYRLVETTLLTGRGTISSTLTMPQRKDSSAPRSTPLVIFG
ncbi:MAG: hypothetical protein PHO79_01170 [Desulfoplanes sp.]|nr:hypothetical protein [Desulfoplanes sp.]